MALASRYRFPVAAGAAALALPAGGGESPQAELDGARTAFDAQQDRLFKDWETVRPKRVDAREKADRARTNAQPAKADAQGAAEGAIAAASQPSRRPRPASRGRRPGRGRGATWSS